MLPLHCPISHVWGWVWEWENSLILYFGCHNRHTQVPPLGDDALSKKPSHSSTCKYVKLSHGIRRKSFVWSILSTHIVVACRKQISRHDSWDIAASEIVQNSVQRIICPHQATSCVSDGGSARLRGDKKSAASQVLKEEEEENEVCFFNWIYYLNEGGRMEGQNA